MKLRAIGRNVCTTSRDYLSLSQVGPVSQIPRWLWRISTVWFTEGDEGAGLVLCREFASVAECNFFSVCSSAPALYPNANLKLAGNASGSARGGQEGTAWAKKSFPNPGPGSADATNSTCFKLDRAWQERPRLSKVLTLGTLLQISWPFAPLKSGCWGKTKAISISGFADFVVIMLEEENWVCNSELSQYLNALSYMKSMCPFQAMNAF